MPKKPEPPPFGPLFRDYDESLRAVILAAGNMHSAIETLLSIEGVITNPVARERLRDAARAYDRAWDGDGDES